MARGYKAILEVKCWKEHTCCYCGVPFRYPLQKLRTGRGSSQQAAVNAAKNSAVHSLRDEQAMRPCPGCGNFQPEMIGGQRLSRHAVLFLITLVVFVSVFILGITDSIPASFAIIVLVICATLIFLANTIVGAAN